MKNAGRILKKKSFIKEFLDSRLPREQSDGIWRDAERRLGAMLRRYADIPKGVRAHTDTYIFPAAAVYLSAKDKIGIDGAYELLESATVKRSAAAGRALAKLMRFPPMRSLFVAIWGPLTKKMFGPNNGFKNVFYPKRKGEFRMDITACPYCRYFGELGCPELTKLFCANDDRVYGNLPGLLFERSGTLGRGAEKCDFYITKV